MVCEYQTGNTGTADDGGTVDISVCDTVLYGDAAYDALDRDTGYRVKRISTKPGQKISVQLHHHRSE